MGRDGTERHYHRISKIGVKRSSLGTSSTTTKDSTEATSPPSSPSVREVRPSVSHDERPHRRSTKYSYAMPSDSNRTVGADGTAIYARPPSLEMPRADGNTERTRSGTATGVQTGSPVQRTTNQRPRPKAIIVDTGASVTSTNPSLRVVSPGLTRVNHNAVPLREPTAKYQARVDSLADDDELETRSLPEANEQQAQLEREAERYQQERISREIDLIQARMERDRMAEFDRRQAERIRRENKARDQEQARLESERIAESDRRHLDSAARQAEARYKERQAQQDRFAQFEQQQHMRLKEAEARAKARAEEAHRERHRQETAVALERAADDAEHKRHVEAEYAQVARERSVADAHVLAAASPRYYEPRSMPASPREITYTAAPRAPISARQITTSYFTTSPTSGRTPISARSPTSARNPVIVHNSYSPALRDSLYEQGDAVIAQAQAAAARNSMQRLNSSMDRMELQDDERLDAVIDARMNRSSSRRQPGQVRERERVRERGHERQKQYYYG